MDFNIDNLSYNELRKLAKQYHIKANQKANLIRTKLKQIVAKSDYQPKFNSSAALDLAPITSSPSFTLREETDGGQDYYLASRDKIEVTGLENLNPPLDASLPASIPTDQPHESTSLSSDDVLNRTYELEEPIMLNAIIDEQPKDQGHIRATFAPDITLPSSQSIIKSPSRSTSKIIKSSVGKVPDFKRIHALANAKLESIPDFLKRRHVEKKQPTNRPPFTSPRYRSPAIEQQPVDHKKPLTEIQVSSSRLPVNQPTSNSLLGSKNSKPTLVKRSQSSIPAQSAFARRKAYDLKHGYTRASLTPSSARQKTSSSGGTIGVNSNARHNHQLSMSSIPSSVKALKAKSVADHHKHRQICRERWLDVRRGVNS